MILSTIKFRGRQEKRTEIKQTLCAITDKVKSSKGCCGAYCLQDVRDRNVFYHIQEWESRKDMEQYLDSKLYAALLGLSSLLTDPPQMDLLHKEQQ